MAKYLCYGLKNRRIRFDMPAVHSLLAIHLQVECVILPVAFLTKQGMARVIAKGK